MSNNARIGSEHPKEKNVNHKINHGRNKKQFVFYINEFQSFKEKIRGESS